MAKRINKNHYVARRPTDSPIPVHIPRSVYSDGEESQRAPSERTLSEYAVRLISGFFSVGVGYCLLFLIFGFLIAFCSPIDLFSAEFQFITIRIVGLGFSLVVV